MSNYCLQTPNGKPNLFQSSSTAILALALAEIGPKLSQFNGEKWTDSWVQGPRGDEATA